VHGDDGNSDVGNSGVVIAGGRSTRFGEDDKAVADLAGTPMIRRVADRIADAVDELVVNCRAEQTPRLREAMAGYPLSVTYAEDDEPDRGPLAGIRNGLRAASGDMSFVVACDVPFVDPDLVGYLFERAADHDAAVPRLDDGWYETTHAVYRTGPMRRACDAALAGDDGRILAAVERLDAVTVPHEEVERVSSADTFENVNTRAELAAAVERIEGRVGDADDS
jgi:molybdopterin-guanine dinucleotide biosynthesis protein A